MMAGETRLVSRDLKPEIQNPLQMQDRPGQNSLEALEIRVFGAK
jgi:hypothetical protein